jgi:3-methyl-2-oxobutanoate hydroxymethyltransferase
MKREGIRIVMVTAYDAAFARLADEAGVDVVLVGDSVGDNVLGFSGTVPVTLEHMVHHTAAVVRGVSKALVIADMPFLTAHLGSDRAVEAAGRLVQDGGAGAVKIEGASPTVLEAVQRITAAGIPVMGHIGLTPQSVNVFGGYSVQGRGEAGIQIKEDALALERAGVIGMVLELIPHTLAREISGSVSVPTIGIGAGPDCDGQVQVLHDLLGIHLTQPPRHARRLAEVGNITVSAMRQYCDEVRSGAFQRPKAE